MTGPVPPLGRRGRPAREGGGGGVGVQARAYIGEEHRARSQSDDAAEQPLRAVVIHIRPDVGQLPKGLHEGKGEGCPLLVQLELLPPLQIAIAPNQSDTLALQP